jgi:hypothetical protein
MLADGQTNICRLTNIPHDCRVQLQDYDCTGKGQTGAVITAVSRERRGQTGGPYLSKQAAAVIEQATDVIVAPGAVWGSILPALATPGLAEAVQGKRLTYIIPFFNRTDLQHTKGWTVEVRSCVANLLSLVDCWLCC